MTGQEIPTIRRHHLGRAVLARGAVLTITAAAPVDRWPAAEDVLRAIVGSYRPVDAAAATAVAAQA